MKKILFLVASEDISGEEVANVLNLIDLDTYAILCNPFIYDNISEIKIQYGIRIVPVKINKKLNRSQSWG